MLFHIKELNGLKTYHPILIIVLASFVIRMLLRSNYLDDWDSVQFILGLNNYSIVAHQPHPPGYPVYVFIGRIVDQFFNNGIESFTFMSSLFGSLALIPTFFLAKDFFSYRVGILSAIILSLAPAEMLFSEVVMSDIVSMFFITATVYLLYRGIKSSKYLYLGSFILAITIGVRQTDFLLASLIFFTCIYKRNIKDLAVSLAILSIGIALWLVPTIIDTGFSNFIVAQNMQGQYAFEHATLSTLGEANFNNLLITIKILISLVSEGWSQAFYIFCIISFAAILIDIGNFPKFTIDKRLIFLTIWILPYIILFIFFYYLYITRYLLPVFPPMAIIFGYSTIKLIFKIKTKFIKILFTLGIIGIIINMGTHSISDAYALHITEPAPISAVKFIEEKYDPNTTIIIAQGSFRHFQYYLPEFSIKIDPLSNPRERIDYFAKNKTIIIERPPSFCNTCKSYTFYRDPMIYPKHSMVELAELNENLKNTFLCDGWYGYENWNNISSYWMNGNATIIITSPENSSIILSLSALSFYRNRTLEVYSGDNLVARVNVPASFLNVSVPVTLEEGSNILRLHVLEGCERPSDQQELNNPDSRCLSIAVQNVTTMACSGCINETEQESKQEAVPHNSELSLVFGQGFYGEEIWSATPTHWMSGNAMLIINSSKNRTSKMKLYAQSFNQNRTLEIYSGDELLNAVIVPSDRFVEIEASVHLAKGTNIIKLHVPEGCNKPANIQELNSTDNRCLSVAIQNIALGEWKPYHLNYGEGFYDIESWSGVPSRWMKGNATLLINSSQNLNASLSLNAQSLYRNRTLQVIFKGVPKAQIAVVPTGVVNVSMPLELEKGANTVQMHVLEGCERPCDIKDLNNPDSRCLSVAFQNIELS